MRIALEATPLVAAAAQAQELARQQALADGPGADVPRDSRPGIYKLSNRRGAHEPAVVPPSPSRPQPVSEPVGAPPSEAPFPAGDSDVPRPFPADASRAAQRPQAERGQLAQRPMAPPLIPAAMREVHSPGTAAWYSVLLPGLGQVYNGQRERGILFALGTPLIVPYLYGIYDAFTTAEDIARGKYAAPDPHTRNAAYVGQIALALAVIFGMFVGALLWHRSRMPQRPPPVAEMPYAPASAPGVTGALPVDVAAPASRQPLGDGLDVDALMKKGRMACAQGLYNECEEIMHEVIARDPGNRDAYNLLVEASSQRKPAPSSAGRSAAP